MSTHDDAMALAEAPGGPAQASAEAPAGSAQAPGRGVGNGAFGVRAGLTPKPGPGDGGSRARVRVVRGRRRPRVEREAQDLEGMVMRMLRALARRARAGDLEALVALCNLGPYLTAQQRVAARSLTSDAGYSWAEIALRLGITRQSAHGRWGGD